MNLDSRFRGCIIGGAIGDAYGSSYENEAQDEDKEVFYLFGKPPAKERHWRITDDTQFTLFTCEFISNKEFPDPARLASIFLRGYKERKVTV